MGNYATVVNCFTPLDDITDPLTVWDLPGEILEGDNGGYAGTESSVLTLMTGCSFCSSVNFFI